MNLFSQYLYIVSFIVWNADHNGRLTYHLGISSVLNQAVACGFCRSKSHEDSQPLRPARNLVSEYPYSLMRQISTVFSIDSLPLLCARAREMSEVVRISCVVVFRTSDGLGSVSFDSGGFVFHDRIVESFRDLAMFAIVAKKFLIVEFTSSQTNR